MSIKMRRPGALCAFFVACASVSATAHSFDSPATANLIWKTAPSQAPCPLSLSSRTDMLEIIEATINRFPPNLRATPIVVSVTTDPSFGGKGAFFSSARMTEGTSEIMFGACMKRELIRASLTHEVSHPLFYAALEQTDLRVGREWATCLSDSREEAKSRCFRFLRTSSPYSEFLSDLVATTTFGDSEAMIRETLAQNELFLPKESNAQRIERLKRLELRSFSRPCTASDLKPFSRRDSYTITCPARALVGALVRSYQSRCGLEATIAASLQATLSALNRYQNSRADLDPERDEDIAMLNTTLTQAFHALATAACAPF